MRHEGKTSTVLNTAVMFAQSGASVLVIDADLRRPRCHEVLGVGNQTGLTEVLAGLYFAGSLDVLRAVAQSPPDDVRLFLGYAGWGPGQLEQEMSEGAWLVAPTSRELIFEVSPQKMWAAAVGELGIDPATLIPTRGVH